MGGARKPRGKRDDHRSPHKKKESQQSSRRIKRNATQKKGDGSRRKGGAYAWAFHDKGGPMLENKEGEGKGPGYTELPSKDLGPVLHWDEPQLKEKKGKEKRKKKTKQRAPPTEVVPSGRRSVPGRKQLPIRNTKDNKKTGG